MRRRFHFVEMLPRGKVLLGWLQAEGKPKDLHGVFEQLNAALREAGVADDHLIGHSYFMSPQIDDAFLSLIWKGTIEPQLREYFFAEPERLKAFQLENFRSEPSATHGPSRQKPAAAPIGS